MSSQPRSSDGRSSLAAGTGDPRESGGTANSADYGIGQALNGIAAQPRSSDMGTTQLRERTAILAGVPQIRYLDEIRILQYSWPAGCRVERDPATGRCVAWFTRRGCRYSSADLADLHAIAVRAAPQSPCGFPGDE